MGMHINIILFAFWQSWLENNMSQRDSSILFNVYKHISVLFFLNAECPSPSYGAECKFTCGHCRDGVGCNPVTGQCRTGCEPGYIGQNCNNGKGETICRVDKCHLSFEWSRSTKTYARTPPHTHTHEGHWFV